MKRLCLTAAALTLLAPLAACDDTQTPDGFDEDLGEVFFGLELDLEDGRMPEFDVQGDALPFVPFTLADLQHPKGAAVSADTMMPLGDGTSRPAGEALELLNEAERQVTAQGSTLRGGVDGIGQPLPEVLGVEGLKEPVRYLARIDTATLHGQRDAYEEALHPEPIAEVRLAGDFSDDAYAEWVEEGGQPGGLGKPFTPPQEPTDCTDEPFETKDGYELYFGTEGLLEASFEAGVKLSGDETKAVFVATGYAGGALFGAEFSIFDVRGRFVGPDEGLGKGHVRATLLGEDVLDEDTGPANWHEDRVSEAVKASTLIPIATLLGVVNVSARIGLKGEAGMRYHVRTSTLGARGAVTPWAATIGFAKVKAAAKIDLGIVKAKLEVGSKAELTFVRDTLMVSGLIQQTGIDCLAFNWWYTGTNALQALSGKLDLFASAQGCVLGLCVGDTWWWRLFQWDGIGPSTTTLFEGRS